MAVSLAQLSNDVGRRRAATVPYSMSRYNPSEVVAMPMPEQYRCNTNDTRNCDYGPYSFFQSANPRSTGQRPHMDPSYQISIPSAVPISPTYYNFSSTFNQRLSTSNQQPSSHYHPSDHSEQPPALPPRPLAYDSSSGPSSPQPSTHSSSGWSSSSFSRSSIEPDPLPPHSNPQALSESQSHAYSNSQRIPALRVGRDEVWNSETGFADFRVAREDGKMPSFMSTKPRLNVIKTSNGVSMGSIRFHSISSNKIELTINGRETSLSHTGFVHNRWGFQSTTCPNTAETWYWKKDKETSGAVLEDAKRSGHILARMKGDLLTFVKPRLSQESYEEIVISAVAMAEAARRQKRKSDVVDIASAIGDFASSDGRHVVESGVGRGLG